MMNKYEKKINELKATNKMYEDVVDDLLEYENTEELKDHLKDLMKYGCSSGIVLSMMTYEDTNNFFDKFEEYIQELTEEIEFEPYHYSIFERQETKNAYSWFAYEQIASELLSILDEEY